jgi:hypothetical protein
LGLSQIFASPLLIYDDSCSSCTKFAKVASIVSRGWIRIAGHYYSVEAMQAKKIIFPAGYDSTRMFWLINKNGAYGARSGLVQVVKEIIIGLYKGKRVKKEENNDKKNYVISCEHKDQIMPCGSTENTLKRIVNMIRSSARFHFILFHLIKKSVNTAS